MPSKPALNIQLQVSGISVKGDATFELTRYVPPLAVECKT